MGLFWDVVVALAGLAVGALLAAIFLRLRLHDMLEAAVAHGRAGLDVEVATQAERLRSQETQLLQARQDLLRLRQEAEALRQEREEAGHERARLVERGARIPSLESQVARLELQLRLVQEELVRLAASEAQKAQALAAHEEARRLSLRSRVRPGYSRMLARRPTP